MPDIEVSYDAFDGHVRSMNVQFGFNQSPTVISMSVAEKKNEYGTITPLDIETRQLIELSIGSFAFRGIVQSYEKAVTNINGTGIYDVRITDTKPVLDAAQVFIGSEIDHDYGDNVISIEPETVSQLSDGIPFTDVKREIENVTLRYGKREYIVDLDFTLPNRGNNIEYTIKSTAMSLKELISQVANDHGLDWYVESWPAGTSSVYGTSAITRIYVRMLDRKNDQSISLNTLVERHGEDKVVRRSEGKENRDPTLKTVLAGAYRSQINRSDGDSWRPFWGLESDGDLRTSPVYDPEVMDKILNGTQDDGEFTEESINKISDYANNYWGRKFYIEIDSDLIDSDGNSWLTPTSAAWDENDRVPFVSNRDAQSKFQTDDGRWVSFIKLNLPGVRLTNAQDITVDWREYLPFPSYATAVYSYSWADSLFSNANTFITEDNTMYVKVTSEIIRSGSRSYLLLTVATPLRLKTVIESDSGESTSEARASNINTAYIALLDKRKMYGPFYNLATTTSKGKATTGKSDIVIDSSLSPWMFGYRGITNEAGFDIMEDVARARLKTVTDTTFDADTFELEVADEPKAGIGNLVGSAGAITNMQITFSMQGVRTMYRSRQFTTELSRHVKEHQELLNKLRRQAAMRNNTLNPPKDDFSIEAGVRALKKELPEPAIETGAGTGAEEETSFIGRIYAREGDSTIFSEGSPHYTITPMMWQTDSFGELSLVEDPSYIFRLFGVVNMAESQTAPGRLKIGTDVEVFIYSTTAGGVTSYYINSPAAAPSPFTAVVTAQLTGSQPRYSVESINPTVQSAELLTSELNKLSNVVNIGEPANHQGNMQVGQQVQIKWNEDTDGSYTPYIEQQYNAFL